MINDLLVWFAQSPALAALLIISACVVVGGIVWVSREDGAR